MRTPQKPNSSASTSGNVASSSGGGAPSPARLTRGALKKMEEGRLTPGLKDPEPKKGRKMWRTILIEYTGGAPRLFRRKAGEIETALLRRVAQVEVVINGNDERPGCFVVREEDEQVFLQLLDMQSPFDRLRDLDVNTLVEEITHVLLTGMPFDHQALINDVDQQHDQQDEDPSDSST